VWAARAFFEVVYDSIPEQYQSEFASIAEHGDAADRTDATGSAADSRTSAANFAATAFADDARAGCAPASNGQRTREYATRGNGTNE